MIPYRTSSTDGYIKRQELLNNVTITNIAGGGSIGTAPTTVDIASCIFITQTTAGQTLTLPTPTASSGQTVIVYNNGTQSFTMLATTITAGSGILAVYDSVLTAWGKIV